MEIDPRLRLRSCRDQQEWPALVAIWRGAVQATHHFLTPDDLNEIESRLMPNYFPAVMLTLAEDEHGVVGFSGTADGKLEMLFVDPEAHGRGIGTALLRHAVAAHPALLVDVNEQNPDALGFYRRHGFEVIGRSEVDADGRPFPLLHLARATTKPEAS